MNNIGYPYTYGDKDKVKYKIELVNRTIYFLKNVTHKTYKVTQVIYKCGVVQKIKIIFVTLVFALGLRFGSSKLIETRVEAPHQIETILEKSGSTLKNKKMEDPESPSVRNFLRVSGSQQEVSDTGSNGMDEIILVQGDGILPGADGFPINNTPRRRHPFGRPRMRGRGINVDPPQNIQGLGNIPEAPKARSFRKVNTDLNARRGNRGYQCRASEFDMKKEYGNFIKKISEEGYELECSQERFNELSTNPQTGSFDEKSLIEAKGGLQGEAQGMYTNIRRPGNKAVDLDFEIDSSKGYTHVDYKTPIDFQDLADNKGIDVSNFPNLETVAYNMGKKISPQKEQFCGLPDGPKSPENVLHVINLDLIRDSNQKQNMIDSVLKGAEDKSNNTVGIYFLNYL